MEFEQDENPTKSYLNLWAIVFPFWVAIRGNTLRALEDAVKKLRKLENLSEMSSSINKSIAITGAAAAVTGCVLLPFTFGLSTAGVVSGAVASLSSVAALTASKAAERSSVVQLLDKLHVLLKHDIMWTERLIRCMGFEKVVAHEGSFTKTKQSYEWKHEKILAYLKSIIYPSYRDQGTKDNYFLSSEIYSESADLSEKKLTGTAYKKSATEPITINQILDAVEDDFVEAVLTTFRFRLPQCSNRIHEKIFDILGEDMAQMLLPNYDDSLENRTARDGGTSEPSSEESENFIPSDKKDSDVGNSDQEFLELENFWDFRDPQLLELKFFEAERKYRKGRNIRYIPKDRKCRSKPKSIRSLMNMLHDLKTDYCEELSKYAEQHRFTVQAEGNSCCSNECTQLFYYEV